MFTNAAEFRESMSSRTRRPIGPNLPIYESEEDSVARQIIRANGRILPVEAEAFAHAGLMDVEFYDLSGNILPDKIRAFYESLKIKIGEPYTALPGWYHCVLPAGWKIDPPDIPNCSRDEVTIFVNGRGKPQFSIVSQKRAAESTAISLWIDEESAESNLRAHRHLRQHRKDYIKPNYAKL